MLGYQADPKFVKTRDRSKFSPHGKRITLRGVLTIASAAIILCTGHGTSFAESYPSYVWYKGNTHTHTLNSDGDSTPYEVAAWYRKHGYQFLFVTDHEYLTDVAPLNVLVGAPNRFLILPGQEVTQHGDDPSRSSAHINSLFASTLIWPVGERRCSGESCGAFAPETMPLAETIDKNISAVLATGALAQVNHPNWRWSLRPEDLNGVPDFTLLEIWNGIDHVNNLGGIDDAGDVRPSAEGFWDYLLSRGKIVWGVGSDDSHTFGDREDPVGARPGQAWIMVRAPELTQQALRRAIERGDFYSSTGIVITSIRADTEELELTLEQGQQLPRRYMTAFIGQDGQILAEKGGSTPRYAFIGKERYVRAVVTDSNGRRAWTQPVFLDERSDRIASLRRGSTKK